MTPHALPGLDRSIVLVGLMGAGKSSIGRRLAKALELPFVDADNEIEAAAGCTIPEIFARFGEESFRAGERRVMERLMQGPVQVIATGGGAFINDETRRAIAGHGISIWLRAELDVLVKRVAKRSDRPLLSQGDPREVLSGLMTRRYPIYAEADIIVNSGDAPHSVVVNQVIEALLEFLRAGRQGGMA